jgi:hypothetical protein
MSWPTRIADSIPRSAVTATLGYPIDKGFAVLSDVDGELVVLKPAINPCLGREDVYSAGSASRRQPSLTHS